MTGEEIKEQVYDAVACDDMFYRPELRDAIYDMVDENEKLASENARLRELVAHYERAVTVYDVKPAEVLEWSIRCDALRKELGIEAEDA